MNLQNPYKRMDIFQCNHESHADFKGRVSVFHVLKEKQCYPHGCISFLWNCTLMNKGKPCVHKYKTVGKSCKGCTHYVDDKIHFQPECMVDDETYELFLEQLESFEAWLERIQYKRVSVAGRIRSIKPHYTRLLQEKETHTRLRGYLLVLKPAYIEMDCFQDALYVRISEGQMKAFDFVPKMKIECTGEIRMDRGRLIVHRPGRFEIVKSGWGKPWTREQALFSIKTAKQLHNQPAQCLACPWGALVDTEDCRGSERHFRRRLFCLKGIENYQGCYIHALLKQKRRKRKKSTVRQNK